MVGIVTKNGIQARRCGRLIHRLPVQLSCLGKLLLIIQSHAKQTHRLSFIGMGLQFSPKLLFRGRRVGFLQSDNSILEVGDPLEGLGNYGAFPYKLNGFTYNLQSLVYIGYFGAPTKDSANKWLAFQNDETHVCPGQ